MTRRPPRSTRTDTLFPYTTLFRSYVNHVGPRNESGVTDIMRRAVAAPTPLRDHYSQDFAVRSGCTSSRAATSSSSSRVRLQLPLCRQHRTRRGTCSRRSEEHTSELQSLMSISYAVSCLKTKKLT